MAAFTVWLQLLTTVKVVACAAPIAARLSIDDAISLAAPRRVDLKTFIDFSSSTIQVANVRVPGMAIPMSQLLLRPASPTHKSICITKLAIIPQAWFNLNCDANNR